MASIWIWTQDSVWKGHGLAWVPRPGSGGHAGESGRVLWVWPDCLHLAFCGSRNALRGLSGTLVPPRAHTVLAHTHCTSPRLPRRQPPWNSWCSRSSAGERWCTQVHERPQLPAQTAPLSQWLCFMDEASPSKCSLCCPFTDMWPCQIWHEKGAGLNDFWDPGGPSRVGDWQNQHQACL